MKIDELIVDLEEWATCKEAVGEGFLANSLRKAAETIRLLWEVARENRLAEYQRQIDEMRYDNG